MKDLWKCFFALFFILCKELLISTSPVFAARVVISCGSVGKEHEVCRSGAQNWAHQTHHEIEVLSSPSSSGERLGQLQLLLAAKSSDIDVFLIDTTWPGMLADFFIDLNSNKNVRQMVSSIFPAFIQNNTVHGKLIAIPWFIDAGLLFYRKDLLEKYHEPAPQTWEDMARIAKKIQDGERKLGFSRFWGFVFEGRAYEGLTCNALEWILSWGGGSIVDQQGRVSIRNPQAVQALELASSWIGTISPRGVLNYMEEDARGVFQSGDAAFLRNWPYVWKLANAPDSPVRGKVGMIPLPQGKGPNSGHFGVLGGWSLAVSKYSQHIPEAVSLITYLASAQEQKRRALILGQNPTIESLYQDPELLKDNPELSIFLQVFEHSFPRPSGIVGPLYNRVSAEFWETVHRVLSKEISATQGLEALEKKLVFFKRGGKW